MSQAKREFADVDEVKEKGRLIKEIEDREIAVFFLDGEFHALLNYCVHIGGPLCEGEVINPITADEDGVRFETDKDVVICPWHNFTFDIKTGQSVQYDRYQVPTYEVEVEDGTIYIEV